VLEREEMGFGASGRNGGFAMTLRAMSLHHLVRNNGVEASRAAHQAATTAVQYCRETADLEGIDCELDYGGLLTVASAAQERKIARDLAAADPIGARDIRLLTGDDVRPGQLVHIPQRHRGTALCRSARTSSVRRPTVRLTVM
jgi:glycine/D-amino acid oxidase-like deaminating enzyme